MVTNNLCVKVSDKKNNSVFKHFVKCSPEHNPSNLTRTCTNLVQLSVS